MAVDYPRAAVFVKKGGGRGADGKSASGAGNPQGRRKGFWREGSGVCGIEGRRCGAADDFEEIDGGAHLLGIEMGELFAVEFEEGGVDGGEECEAVGGDAGGDDAAVLGVAGSGEQAAGFEAVEEAGDVGIAGDHVTADGFAGHALIAGAAEDAQEVVLDVGEVVGLEEFLEAAEEEVCGAQNVKEDFLFDAIEGANASDFLCQLPTHGAQRKKQGDKCKWPIERGGGCAASSGGWSFPG